MPWYRATLVTLVVALLVPGCGTRVASEDVGISSSSGHAPSNEKAGAGPPAEVPSVSPPTDDAASAPPGGSGSTPVPNPRSAVGTGAQGGTNPRPSDSTDSGKSQPRAEEGPSSAGASAAGPPSLAAGPPAVSDSGPRSPILVASVGTYSGPIGSALEPILKGAQLWVKAMNAKGGLNGHQIKLFVYDDGGDPAKHRAQVQDAVEHRGILGFLMNAEAFTGAGSVEYLNAKRIPVVGMDLGEHWAYSSPMYFPQGPVGDELIRTYALAIAQQVLPRGKQRFGTLICVEAPCDRPDRVVGETARKAGLDHVYRGRASLAQPDYTAECLSARNQAVEVLAIILDVNSVNRVTAACARQGFHPLYAVFVMDDKMKDNPELAGALAISPVFPFFQSGSPATDEFRAALRDYGGGMVVGNTTAFGVGGRETAGTGRPRHLRTADHGEPPGGAVDHQG